MFFFFLFLILSSGLTGHQDYTISLLPPPPLKEIPRGPIHLTRGVEDLPNSKTLKECMCTLSVQSSSANKSVFGRPRGHRNDDNDAGPRSINASVQLDLSFLKSQIKGDHAGTPWWHHDLSLMQLRLFKDDWEHEIPAGCGPFPLFLCLQKNFFLYNVVSILHFILPFTFLLFFVFVFFSFLVVFLNTKKHFRCKSNCTLYSSRVCYDVTTRNY